MIDCLSADINNPFFYCFVDSQKKHGVEEIVRQIAEECSTRIEASELTRKLEEKGLDVSDLSPSELNLIDDTFDCWE